MFRKGELALFDMVSGEEVNRWSFSADVAMVNPTSKILALRGQKTYYIGHRVQDKRGTIIHESSLIEGRDT